MTKFNESIIEASCNSFESSYIFFQLAEKQNPRTWIIEVITDTRDETVLGQIRWYAQWRQYGFYPSDGTVFEKTCLDDITKFVRLMNKHQSQGIKPSNPQMTLEGGLQKHEK